MTAKKRAPTPTPKPKRKPGRPKVLTPEVEQALLDLVVAGTTVSEACAKLGIGYTTVAKKEIEGGSFCGLLARARVAGAARTLDEAEDKLRNATAQNIMARRELASHLRWKASKLIPLYSDRLSVGLQADVTVRTKHRWEGKEPAHWEYLDRHEFMKHMGFGILVLAKDMEEKLCGAEAIEVLDDVAKFIRQSMEHDALVARAKTQPPVLRAPSEISLGAADTVPTSDVPSPMDNVLKPDAAADAHEALMATRAAMYERPEHIGAPDEQGYPRRGGGGGFKVIK